MAQPPFSGNDFFDQIDSVARNLTGNAFRLKRDDPDAPQKFTEFVAQSEQEFNATQPIPQAAQPTQTFQDFERGGFQINPAGDRRAEILAQQQAQADAAGPSLFDRTLGRGIGALGRGHLEAFEELSPVFDVGGALGAMARPHIPGIQETEFDRQFAEARAREQVEGTNPFARTLNAKSFREALPSASDITLIGDPRGASNPVLGLGRALTGEGNDPLWELNLAELGAAAADPLNILPVTGTTAPLRAGSRVVTGAGKKALSAADEAAAAIGRTGVGNVLDPVPPQTVAGRAARAAGGVPDFRRGANVGNDEIPPAMMRIFKESPGADGATLSRAEQIELRDFLREKGTDFNSSPSIGGIIRGTFDRSYGGDPQIYVGSFKMGEAGLPQYVVWNPSKGKFRTHGTAPDATQIRTTRARIKNFGIENVMGRPHASADETIEIFGEDIPQSGLRPSTPALTPPTTPATGRAARGAGVDLDEKLTAASGQVKAAYGSPQSMLEMGEEYPRYWYHYRVAPVAEDGGINATRIREPEAADMFGANYAEGEYIWLSPTPIRSLEDSLIVDISKLTNNDIRSTGQFEGNILHRGNIPKSAIVEAPTTPARGRAAARQVTPQQQADVVGGPNRIDKVISQGSDKELIEERVRLTHMARGGYVPGARYGEPTDLSPQALAAGDDVHSEVASIAAEQADLILPDIDAEILRRGIPDDVLVEAIRSSVERTVVTTASDVKKAIAPTGTGARLADDVAVDALDAAPQNIEEVAARRAAVDAVQSTDNPSAVPKATSKVAHIEQGAPDIGGSPPPKRPGGPTGPVEEPSESLRAAIAQKLPNERIEDRLLVRHISEINIAQTESRRAVDAGNDLLKQSKWGVRRGLTRAPQTTDDIELADRLRAALHNEGPVPAGQEEIFDLARQQTDFESAARIDFDPEMATVEDYFDRGWKAPKEIAQGKHDSRGRLVTTPGFRLPRVNASYAQMRERGFEPLFWNPFEQIHYSRMRGVRYRQQMELVSTLKELGEDVIQPWSGAERNMPAGWRVPKVGPAFEGKPFTAIDPVTNEPVAAWTRRFIVPNRLANKLENMYGKNPNLRSVHVGGRDIDILKAVNMVTFTPKQIKLMGSFFQDVDFLTRLGGGSYAKAVDDILAGKPIESVKSLLRYPVAVADVLRARVSPGHRRTLRDLSLNDTKPIIEGRPGVTVRKIMEAGLSLKDRTILPDNLDQIVREAAEETGAMRIKSVARAVGDFERAFRQGLFSGTYPASILNDVINNITHIMARTYPDLTDTQLVARIAEQANIKYSVTPPEMSVIQNRVIRESALRLFFSIGESEGLLRQFTRTFYGPNKAFWTKQWIGMYLFLISTANIIHFTTTGEALPKERYSPISKDSWGPLPFGYNTQFASPQLPGKLGREGIGATLDLVGQMDTVFRVLNPKQFTESRFSVPVRALLNQISGTDFYDEPIDGVGPGGIVSRTVQFAIDMFAPIGLGKIAQRAARESIPGAADVLTQGDTQLSTLGLGVEATGVNLRARPRSGIIDREAQKRFSKNLDDLNQLERYQIEQDPEIGPQLAQLDTESAERGQAIPRYRNRRKVLHNQQIALTEEALNDMIREILIGGGAEAWNATNDLSKRVSKSKATMAARLDEFRLENDLTGYTGEPPNNDFDKMLEEWYALIDKHTDKLEAKDQLGNVIGFEGELDTDKWFPASEQFIENLSPKLQKGLAEWRRRKETAPAVQEILDARVPNRKLYGVNKDGEPKWPSGNQLWELILGKWKDGNLVQEGILQRELGITTEQLIAIRDS
jgi:hypothetical protein